MMIEEEQKLESAIENSLAKSKFLARMSHEIRTPITAVIGISEIQLQNPNLSMDVEEAFAKIYDSAGILLGIINDILDISKIEAGKMELFAEKYSVSGIIADTIQMFLMYIGSKRVKLSVNADENMPACLRGDELRLKQIINNILSNAINYTHVGSVALNVCCEPEPGGKTILVIKVTDTGKGMTKEQVAALRDEYTRFHEKTDHFTQGTGLGMSIVYNLVDLMGGAVDVESELEAGTTVTVRLPQEIASQDVLGRKMADSLQCFDPSVLTGKQKIDFTPEPMPYGSVLVVDDVETNLYVAKGLLNFYGIKVETSSNGRQAVDRIKQGEVFDIIFMDHMMPEMDGIEATRIIRRLGYTLPIVAFTANALIGQAEEFMKNGFDNFISKPIQAVHLNAIFE